MKCLVSMFMVLAALAGFVAGLAAGGALVLAIMLRHFKGNPDAKAVREDPRFADRKRKAGEGGQANSRGNLQ